MSEQTTAAKHKHKFHANRIRGRRSKARHKDTDRGRNNGTFWQRIRENLADLKSVGLDPAMGTEIGRLFIFEVITENQVGAAELYAEIAGRYARYHAEARRTAASPTFQRSFRGYDNELQKHTESGTTKAYERRGRRAASQWRRLQRCVPNRAAQDILEMVCLDGEHLPNIYHDDFRRLLDRIIKEFGGGR